MEYMAKAKIPHRAAGAHGAGLRGDLVNRGSRTFVGRFGRMFRTLPAAEFDQDALIVLAEAMSAPAEEDPNDETKPKPAREIDEPTPDEMEEGLDAKFHDGEENTGIAAGYTYLGQFIDHDITFDPASSLQKKNDPDGLINFRTPALDLDSVYGRGPDDQPYMFEKDGKTFRLGKELTFGGKKSSARDLLRLNCICTDGKSSPISPARAIIGDKRNDENVIVSQLQGVFIQFHNRLVNQDKELALRDKSHKELTFAEIQRKVRWHYQYVVLNDFLPTIVGDKTMDSIWPGRKYPDLCEKKPNLCFYHPHNGAYMPIEFAAAAYRFGHSMVRPIYRLNTVHDMVNKTEPDDERDRNLAGRFFIFAGVQKRGLNGFDEFPTDWAIDWSLYFDINNSINEKGKKRVQPAYKIDTSIVNPLVFLPEFSKFSEPPPPPETLLRIGDHTLQPEQMNPRSPSNLAIRNLLRGNAMGLPSGQDVALAMGLEPLDDTKLRVGKAQVTVDDKANESEDSKPLSDVIKTAENLSPEQKKNLEDHFKERVPLWFYVLAEAQNEWRESAKGKSAAEANKIGATLGPVGGRIVAETLIGLLLADSHSYLNQYPKWVPEVGNKGKDFKMGDFIKYALDLKG